MEIPRWKYRNSKWHLLYANRHIIVSKTSNRNTNYWYGHDVTEVMHHRFDLTDYDEAALVMGHITGLLQRNELGYAGKFPDKIQECRVCNIDKMILNPHNIAVLYINVEQAMRDAITQGLVVTSNTTTVSIEYKVRTPFYDNMGDPINIHVSVNNDGNVVVHDEGAIAGMLFSMSQDTSDKIGYQILKQLEVAYDLKVDYNEGLVQLNTNKDQLCGAVLTMTKLVMSINTILPYILQTTIKEKSS